MQNNNGKADEDENELNEKFKESDSTIRKHLQLLEDEGYSTIYENTHTLTAKGLAFETFQKEVLKEEKKEREQRWIDWPKRNWLLIAIATVIAASIIAPLLVSKLKSKESTDPIQSKPATPNVVDTSSIHKTDSLP